MCTVVLTRFVCLFICFRCYVQLWTEAPLVITLVSSRLVSPVPWHFGRSRFHLFVYGSSQKNDIIFLQTCLLPGHPLRYMCYPLWADHSLSVTGWFTSFYAKTEAFSWLKRQARLVLTWRNLVNQNPCETWVTWKQLLTSYCSYQRLWCYCTPDKKGCAWCPPTRKAGTRGTWWPVSQPLPGDAQPEIFARQSPGNVISLNTFYCLLNFNLNYSNINKR